MLVQASSEMMLKRLDSSFGASVMVSDRRATLLVLRRSKLKEGYFVVEVVFAPFFFFFFTMHVVSKDLNRNH